MKSIFTDKKNEPDAASLKKALGATFELWKWIRDYVKKADPHCTEEWKFASEKFGWSFRMSDKKRVIVYLLPRDNFFKVALVFGDRAMGEILKSKISLHIIEELKSAKAYAEGRGIRVEIRDKTILNDIGELISIKMRN